MKLKIADSDNGYNFIGGISGNFPGTNCYVDITWAIILDYTGGGFIGKNINRMVMECAPGNCAEKWDICGILTWQNKKLSLHLDHINGTNNDHRLKNLRLLCPNCHSLTPTYCGKNKKKKKKFLKSTLPKKSNPICLDCKKPINRKAIRCKSCAGKYIQKTKINWPETQQLIKMIKQSSYTKIAQKLGVSDNAIRKRIKRHP